MEQTVGSKVTAQAASGGTLVKLVIFSVSLGVLPLASYYLSLRYVWNGNATWAAITAIIAANLVLVTYIIASLLEDTTSSIQKPVSQSKKDS
ncbi:hypothetical protein BDZ89DRAFT_1055815 [Hymenopellis radicata]|nr:hypothetical protein BDZ89DRAFT_1055815 [Hymenopellis radicata]